MTPQIKNIAEIEADRVFKATDSVGGWQSVSFGDSVTHAVIVRGFGGWDELCSLLPENMEEMFRKKFIRLYNECKRQGVEGAGYLPGRAEIENNAKGFRHPEDIIPIKDKARIPFGGQRQLPLFPHEDQAQKVPEEVS